MRIESRRSFFKSSLFTAFGGFLSLLNINKVSGNEYTDSDYKPGYLKLHKQGELKRRGEE